MTIPSLLLAPPTPPLARSVLLSLNFFTFFFSIFSCILWAEDLLISSFCMQFYLNCNCVRDKCCVIEFVDRFERKFIIYFSLFSFIVFDFEILSYTNLRFLKLVLLSLTLLHLKSWLWKIESLHFLSGLLCSSLFQILLLSFPFVPIDILLI